MVLSTRMLRYKEFRCHSTPVCQTFLLIVIIFVITAINPFMRTAIFGYLEFDEQNDQNPPLQENLWQPAYTGHP